MAVTKQKRSYINQPIGVTRFETGETQMWETVANTAGQLNQLALKEGAKQAEQRGLDAAMAVEQVNLIGFDAETGAPKALDPSLFSGGIIARDAYKKAIQTRFRDSIEIELKNKAAELQLEYRYEPSKFREEMSRYVADMHENAQGKWKETVKVAGTAIVNSTGLYIESETKKQQDTVLGNHFINKAQKILDVEIDAILNSGDLNIAFDKARQISDEMYEELLNASSANQGYVISSKVAETFKNQAIAKLTTRKLQSEFNNPENLIPLNIDGNNSRINILSALEAQNSDELNPTEQTVYNKIIEFSKENPSVLTTVVKENRNFILNQNKNAIIQQNRMTSIEWANQADKIDAQSDMVDDYFSSNNFAEKIQTGGEIDRDLEALESELKLFTTLYANDSNYQPKIKMLQDKVNSFKSNLESNIINKLVVGKDGNTIDGIRRALGNINNPIPSNATQQDKNLIAFFHKHNLQTNNFANVFSTERNLYNGAAGKRRDKQVKLSSDMAKDFGVFAANNDYETVLEESKKYYKAVSKQGELQDLGATSVNKYKGAIDRILIEKSGRRIKFSNTSEIILAKSYIESNGKNDDLNKLPEVKKIIDETFNIRGSTLNSLDAILNTKYAIHNRNEMDQRANEVTLKKINEINNGEGTDASHAELANDILFDFGNGKTHRENLTGLNNPAYVNQLSTFMTKGTIPKSFASALENLASNKGNYTEKEASALLQLYAMYANGTHLEGGQPIDFFENTQVSNKTRAILEVASDLSNTMGTENVLNYISNANKINEEGFKQQIKDVTEEDSIQKFLETIDKDITADRIARDHLHEVVKYSVLQNLDKKEIKTRIKKIFERRFPETEGFVKDFANQNSNRSRHALGKIFPEQEIKQAFIKNAKEELGALGYTFGELRRTGTGAIIIGEQGNAILIPVESSDQSVVYLAYKEEDDGGLTLIRKASDEFGASEPLVFGTNEGYLKEFRDRLRLSRDEINQKLVEEAKESKFKDKKLEEFRNRDAKKISIMGN